MCFFETINTQLKEKESKGLLQYFESFQYNIHWPMKVNALLQKVYKDSFLADLSIDIFKNNSKCHNT